MSSYQTKKTPGDTAWFTHDRFGMFIHWGLYAMPARHEWIKTRERMTDESYDRYFRHFDPDLYDPKQWARLAKAAGMKYAVMTAKHHEGFCMFDSQYTDYKCTNTPAGRDLLREYVDAFRAEGLRVGFYYSLIDWHHPDFTVDMLHPRRDDPQAQTLNEGRDMRRYARYMRNQVTELLTNYRKIDILWFDFSYSERHDGAPWMRGKGREDWESEELIATARSLAPDLIIDNRAEVDQDVWTPEQYQPKAWLRHPPDRGAGDLGGLPDPFRLLGLLPGRDDLKSPEMLIRMLVETVSLGGNFLMNVGPTARGYLDSRAQEALEVYARWMQVHSRSIYGCTMAEPSFQAPQDCRLTQSADGKRLYVHLFAYPFAYLEFHGLAGKVDYVQFLHDASEVRFTEGKVDHFSLGATQAADLLVLELPAVKPDVLVPVLEIFLKD